MIQTEESVKLCNTDFGYTIQRDLVADVACSKESVKTCQSPPSWLTKIYL